jgi:hypothetical protein
MFVIERAAGEAVHIGPHVLRVLAVHPDHVVVALLDPDEDGAGLGNDPVEAVAIPGGWSTGVTDGDD